MSDILITKEVINAISESENNTEIGGYKETPYPFRPVRCLQKDLDEKIKSTNGYIYFTLDTQKIYYGTGTEFLPMGGSSGIYYANKTFEEDNPDDTTFYIEHFENGSLPTNIDDLIINVGNYEPRNGFYQVVEINEEEGYVLTRHLPVGGGGSGTGGSAAAGTVDIIPITPQAGSSIRQGEAFPIYFTLQAKDSNGDLVLNGGNATWSINNVKYDGGTVYNGQNVFDVGPYLSSAVDQNEIKLTVSINTGGVANNIATKQWQVKAINLELTWDWNYSPDYYIDEDTFTLFFTPYGNTDSEVFIWFDGNQLDAHVVKIPAKNMGSQMDVSFPSLDYGSHTVNMYLGASINDTYYKTNIIQHELTFIKNGISPILTVPFYQTVASQYETIQIPFLVYDPNNVEANVDFLVNDTVITTDAYSRSLQYIPYTFGVSGTLKLGLRCGSAIWDITLTVTPLELDVEEVPGYAFKLKANDFSGNAEIRNWNSNGVTLSVSDNFDWVNGGLQSELDEDGHLRKYICIKNGTRLTINYELFGNDGYVYGKNFKIIFKAVNCYNYDAQILDCFYTTNETTGRGIGIKLNAQNATFSSNEIEMVTQYYENSYIELEAEIFKRAAEGTANPDNFMMFWVDGVPSAVKVYEYEDFFKQPFKKSITIGSDDCDVYIYLVKAYEKQLTEDNHLDNFIIDAPNTEEMLKRFERNDILDNNGEISYTKLVEKNPNCYAHLYEIPRMCYAKKPPVEGCSYQQYYKDASAPALTATDVEMRVQGTSSIAYGVGAFNIDTEFTTGFTDKDDNHLDKWGMSNTAIPVDYFCTKVNVASCENANNALNQEWYNRFQPYWDGHRRKARADGKTPRDCMEFIPGVLFIKDNNPTVYQIGEGKTKDDYYLANCFTGLSGEAKYASAPYYKQYAICNMGNSKDNIEVFHDIDNPNACCVEVGNNQDAEHWMTVKIDTSTFDLDDPYYEFRYPDGNDEASQAQKEAWVRFVNWMASCDPNPYDEISHPYGYTGEELSAPVTFSAKKYEGFIPPGFNTPSPSGITLAGTTEATYANVEYTHDTYEYRMAKMLNECEDYLVMDSVVYHYLFIERHTMVDNVAKNTFWSTEDLLHWDLTKNYDNDTADGNNNTGFLVYSYGIEPMDNETADKKVFNATDSVWFTFIHGLKDTQKNLYNQYAGSQQFNAWDPADYLATFKNFQNCIPERCWIYDYFRKYIRPRRLGLDDGTFLMRLEGGKKTHQRTQYETYHNFYLNTKYETESETRNDVIDIRANSGPGYKSGYVTPVSYYVDCYALAQIGGKQFKEKVKRGEKCNIKFEAPSLGDATVYYGGAKMIQEFEGIEYLYPGYVSLTPAIRLRTLQLGADEVVLDDGSKIPYYNDNLTEANFSSNTMLESASVQNSGATGSSSLSSLNLSNLKSLKYLNISGSTYPGLVLADSGLIEELHLNSLTSLRMTNLTKLTTFTADEGIYNTLNTVYIDNCPLINTYDLVLNSKIISYYLGHVNWEITSSNDIEITNNIVTSIKILDWLLREGCQAASGYTTQTALTGTLTINVAGCKIDEYYLYEKYHNKFPNLIINFGENINVNDITYAYKIRFFENDLIDSDILYEVSIDPKGNTMPLSLLTSQKGPTGIEMGVPIKEETVTTIFTWDSTDENSDWATYKDGEKWEPTHEEMLAYIPTNSMDFTPIFMESPRQYKIVLKDENEEILNISVSYGTIYDLPTFLYKEHENSILRWAFKGWISPTDYLSGTKNPTLITDTSSGRIVVTEDFYAYAFYEAEDCTLIATDSNYFNFNKIASGIYAGSYQVSLKDDYRTTLQGKITLPAEYLGQTVVSVGGFGNAPNITHVYFQQDNSYRIIEDDAFSNNGYEKDELGLVAVFLPPTLTKIGNKAFLNQINLKQVNLEDLIELTTIGESAFRMQGMSNDMCVKISALPPNLTSIGHSAFYKGGDDINITTLPNTLTNIAGWAFSYCKNVNITQFGIDQDRADIIGDHAFYESGKSVVDNIYIGKSIRTIGNNAFGLYGATALIAHFPYPTTNDATTGNKTVYNSGDGMMTESFLGVTTIEAPDWEEVY